MRAKFKWYAARLAAMSAAEISHRIIELVRKSQLARHAGGWQAFYGSAPAPALRLPELKMRLARVPSISVDEVLKGARFLGLTPAPEQWQGGAPLQSFWHLDPISGRQWPGRDVSAFTVDVRSTSASPKKQRPFGDVKFVWEPNRLQILQSLAVIMARGGADAARARDTGVTILESWMLANPPFHGVNWISGIEVALRLVSLTIFMAALETDDGDRALQERLAAFVAAHARHLSALPSLYSSANNHRVAEGLGLFLAGILTPAAPKSSSYRPQGQHILESETLKQIFADGVGGEQSPTYQAFTMELVAFGALVGAETGSPFAPGVLLRLSNGAKFLADLQYDDGATPAIGDDDEGRALLLPHIDEPKYAASVAASVAALARPDELFHSAAPGYLREYVFGVAPGAGEQQFAPGINVYGHGGYSILRQMVAGKRLHLVFDHGPLGYGALAAHGHADALAIWLAVDGKPVFIDAGTWLYHSGEHKRHALRSSQAHNTLSLPGLSQSEPSAAFSWANKAFAQACEPDLSITEGLAIAGVHDGFVARCGFRHRRDVAINENGIIIADRLLESVAPCPVEISFLCGPDMAVRIAEGRAEIAGVNNSGVPFVLRLAPPEGFEISVIRGQTDGQHSGQYSPRFNQMDDTARILLSGLLGTKACRTLIEIGTPPLV